MICHSNKVASLSLSVEQYLSPVISLIWGSVFFLRDCRSHVGESGVSFLETVGTKGLRYNYTQLLET